MVTLTLFLTELAVNDSYLQGYWYLELERATKNHVFEKLRPMAEDWIGNKLRLTGTSVYGIRKYTRGATLAGHLDHMRSHVVSAILNIAQAVDTDWPLQIYDHAGQVSCGWCTLHTCHVTSTLVCDWLQLHHVMLQPGEMVWYESAKLLHGRSQPLNGTRCL